MFLKNITFLIFLVKMVAKTFFLFKVREAGAAFEIYYWTRGASFLAGSDSLFKNIIKWQDVIVFCVETPCYHD